MNIIRHCVWCHSCFRGKIISGSKVNLSHQHDRRDKGSMHCAAKHSYFSQPMALECGLGVIVGFYVATGAINGEA